MAISEQTIRKIAERARHLCEYCRSRSDFSLSRFTVEHIHPKKLGGTDSLSNLAWSCGNCNSHKAVAIQALDPATLLMTPLFHPRNQKWHDHFMWSEDELNIIGITLTGRATIERLQMNRQEAVNLRKLLIPAGLHPPDDTT